MELTGQTTDFTSYNDDHHHDTDDNHHHEDDMEDYHHDYQGELANGVDWADDGVHLAASTSDLEILLWETNLCRPVNISTSLNFSSSSATLSWRTLGAWSSSPVPPTTCASSQVSLSP